MEDAKEVLHLKCRHTRKKKEKKKKKKLMLYFAMCKTIVGERERGTDKLTENDTKRN
jgi:hypothetical protein